MEKREKEIIKTLREKGKDGLKALNVTGEEIDKIVSKIDEKMKLLGMEETKEISKKLNYNLPIDYCVFYSKQLDEHIKPNLFKLGNNIKSIRVLMSMNPDSKNYIMKFQQFDSQYKDKIVPFAQLEFGDLLCFEKNSNDIVYYDHETDQITKLAKKWDDFVKELYGE